MWKRFFFWLDIYQLFNTVFCVFPSKKSSFYCCCFCCCRCCCYLLLLSLCRQCKIDARWRLIHWFNNELISICNEHNFVQWSKWTNAKCLCVALKQIFFLLLIHADGIVKKRAQCYTKNLLLLSVLLLCFRFVWYPPLFSLVEKSPICVCVCVCGNDINTYIEKRNLSR